MMLILILFQVDRLVSTDVRLLRDAIDQASLDFLEAQKRYEKSERELVDSKVSLHREMERKESLIEQLCLTIEMNESVKAKRLKELMEKMELDEEFGEDELKDDNNGVSLNEMREFHEIDTIPKERVAD